MTPVNVLSDTSFEAVGESSQGRTDSDQAISSAFGYEQVALPSLSDQQQDGMQQHERSLLPTVLDIAPENLPEEAVSLEVSIGNEDEDAAVIR